MKITSILSILALAASAPLAFALPEPIPEALAAADPVPLPQESSSGSGAGAGPTCRRPQDEKVGTRCGNRGKRVCNCAQDAIVSHLSPLY